MVAICVLDVMIAQLDLMVAVSVVDLMIAHIYLMVAVYVLDFMLVYDLMVAVCVKWCQFVFMILV